MTSTLEQLLGAWTVERRIWDRRADITGSFVGTALLRPDPADPNRARYEETGTMTYGDHEGPARRQLLYVGRPDGTVDVLFADGHRFVVLDLRAARWSGSHPCREDRYELTLEVLDADVLEERWRVRGPAKDYEAMTLLTRAD